jgi:hypothetical protein
MNFAARRNHNNISHILCREILRLEDRTNKVHPSYRPTRVRGVRSAAAGRISPLFRAVRVPRGVLPHHQRSTTAPRALGGFWRLSNSLSRAGRPT